MIKIQDISLKFKYILKSEAFKTTINDFISVNIIIIGSFFKKKFKL